MVSEHRLLLFEVGAHDSLLPFAVGQCVLYVPYFLVLLGDALDGAFTLEFELALPLVKAFPEGSKAGSLPLHFHDLKFCLLDPQAKDLNLFHLGLHHLCVIHRLIFQRLHQFLHNLPDSRFENEPIQTLSLVPHN